MKRAVLLSVFAVTFVAGAGTVYVDCNLKDYAGHDGSSWAAAYKTIQEGVKAAQTDDTVLVAPGWYDEGGTSLGSDDAYLTNRVTITKRITVRSKEGRATRDSTFIVGRHATNPEDPDKLGMGPDAIRCVRFSFDNATHGAIVEGFTLLNGATHYNNGSYAMRSIGGGACFGNRTTSDTTGSYLVDCVVSNCVATRGGGIYFGNAVRTRFTGNKATSNAPAVRDGNLYYCLIDGANVGSSGICYLGGCKAIGCTIANCVASTPLRGNSVAADNQYTPCLAYNTVVLQFVSSTGYYLALTNCVTTDNTFYWDSSKNPHRNGDCTYVAMNSYQFVSSATGDFRPLATGDLVGAGRAEWQQFIPAKFRYVDYAGNAVPETGAICAGAITRPETPVGGVVHFESIGYQGNDQCSLFVNGYEQCVDKLYSFGTTFPAVYQLDVEMPRNPKKLTQRHYFGCSLGLNSSSTLYNFPLRGTRRHYIMGPPAGSDLLVIPRVAENAFWADPSVADGAAMDGTEAKPFNTLQAAVDRAETTNGYIVVYAKKGRYEKGGKFYGGLTNRVAITKSGVYVRLYAVDGPQETFIVGKGDAASTHAMKYGDAAVRCYATCTSCAQLSGFTLTDGRVTLNNGSEDPGMDGLYGGAVWGAGGVTGYQVEDCVITNCAGSRGAIAWRGVLRRCLVTDCTSTRLGALRGTVHASACIFKDVKTTCTGSSTDYIVGQDEVMYNCDFISTVDNPLRLVGNNTGSAIYNSVVYRFGYLANSPNATLEGSYYDECATVESSAKLREGLTYAKMGFADLDGLDLALYSSSRPAAGGNVNKAGGDFWRYGSAVDFEGNLFVFGADGSMPAGAFQRTVPSVSVVTDGTGVTPTGETFLTGDSPTLTLTATEADTRNFAGFYRGDELVSAEATYAIAYGDLPVGSRLELEARYIPFWYVDPKGDDAHGGRSWADAKKTLAAVMALARDGDTVFAAPGVYEEGSARQNIIAYAAPSNICARVVVPEGVSLVSRDGAAATTIKGRRADVDEDGYGGGATALRCAYLYPRAKLVGFTLTGGRCSANEALCDDARGAGVHGSGPYGQGNWSEQMPVVKDCIITDNVTRRGAGATFVKAVNCRFTGNRATGLAAAAQHCELHNCFVDENHGSYALAYNTGLFSCTIGAHHDGTSVLGPSAFSGYNQRPYVYNSLILCSKIHTGDAGGTFTNCVFNAAVLTSWPINNPTNDTCIFAPLDQLAVDTNGVPVPGANLALDHGVTNYLNLVLCDDTDCAGNPRRVNGERMDVGCYEADWKARYSADLNARRAAVTAASPSVWETETRSVQLTDGSQLALDFLNPRGRHGPQIVTFRVTGGGTLELRLPGGETRSYSASQDVQNYTFRSTGTQTLNFSFAGAGSAEILACQRDDGTIVVFR